MDLRNHWSWILWIFSRLSKYLLGLLLECNLLFTASGTFSGGGGNDRSFSLVDSYLSASQNACCLLVLWAALNPCQERDLARPPVVPESPLGGGWEGGGLDNLSFTALIEMITKWIKKQCLCRVLTVVCKGEKPLKWCIFRNIYFLIFPNITCLIVINLNKCSLDCIYHTCAILPAFD